MFVLNSGPLPKVIHRVFNKKGERINDRRSPSELNPVKPVADVSTTGGKSKANTKKQ